MQGKIVKGIAGFYYVHVVNHGVYECKAKGIFRNRNIKPLVGDNVEIQLLDEQNKLGSITDIKERQNELIRPAVANINQALVVFAIAEPMPNLNLLDRFLVMMEKNNIDTVICFNKTDLAEEEKLLQIKDIYVKADYHVIFTSAIAGIGMEELKRIIDGKTTAFAGPSGVGKSSILNALMPQANSKTGSISEKIKRGKHTTRHTELFRIDKDTFVADTPGFTSLNLPEIEAERLRYYFKEFEGYEGKCRFDMCTHLHEPDCAVKKAVEAGEIAEGRYNSYSLFFKELRERSM